MTALLEHAQQLTAAGVAVLPVRDDGTKAPAVDWKPYQATPPTPDQVRAWFTGTTHGLGIITGTVSAGLEMTELEGRAAARLPELRALAYDTGLGDLWDTITRGWVETSPSGGWHFHYRVHGPVLGNTKLARRPSTPDELQAWKDAEEDKAMGIADDHLRIKRLERILTTTAAQVPQVLAETRGEGGFVVVAPTPGTHHPSGRPWVTVLGGPDTVPTITPEQRGAFHAILRTLDQMPAPEAPERAATASPRADLGDGVTPGDDYEAKTDWADLLVPEGWTHVTTRGRTRYWRRPGKNDGFSATTGHADDRDRLYVFTSSTVFEPEHPYTKFGAYALLRHGGDHSAAARALAADGYGTRRDPGAGGGINGLIPPLSPAQQLAAAATMTGDTPWTTTSTTSVPSARSAPVEPTAAPSTGGTPLTAPAAGTDPSTPTTDEPAEQARPSWEPVDLTAYLDGTHTPETPQLLERSDGQHLIYPGLVHDFHGESESGKSLVAQALTAIEVQAGHDVLYVDFESGPHQLVGRLLDLGCTPQQIRDHFTYVRPEVSPYALVELQAWQDLLQRTFTLAVLDGVTDALGQFGGGTKENDDIAAWHRAVPRMLTTRTTAAVILIDHVVKNGDTRGRFALGGQAKMAAIDGASYVVEITEPIGKGMRGVVTLRIGKDRPGEIRPACGKWRQLDRTQEAARVTIDSTGGGIDVTIDPPTDHVTDGRDDGKPFKPTGVMERLSRLLETRGEPISYRKLLEAYKADGGTGRERTVADAVDHLITAGHVSAEPGPNRARMLRSLSVYRQRTDPDSDSYIEPLTGLIAPVSPSVSDCLPVSPGDSEVGVSRRLPPVGETETLTGAGHSPVSPDAKPLRFDVASGEWFDPDPDTGEVVE